MTSDPRGSRGAGFRACDARTRAGVLELIRKARSKAGLAGWKACSTLVLAALASLPLPAQQAFDIVEVASKAVERKLRLPGEFLPYLSVDLHARVAAFVEKVDVDRGSLVRSGQTLVSLSAPELASQTAEAEAKAAGAEAERAEAQARLASAETTYEHLKTAAATPGVVAGNDLKLSEQAVNAARALMRARESSVKAARAAADSLRELEGYLTVKAPFDGVVTERFVHPGALVGPGAGSGQLLHLAQMNRLRLVLALPESQLAGIERGARMAFTVPAFPEETFSGVLARVSRAVDPKTRTMPVELDVANAGGRLAPGMYPEVQWSVSRAHASLLVPPSSVVTTTERTFVIRLKNGLAEYVNVRRGAPAGDLVEVFGALKPGDPIVRRATDEIREGTRVRER